MDKLCRNCDGTGSEVYYWNDERRVAECRDCHGTGILNDGREGIISAVRD